MVRGVAIGSGEPPTIHRHAPQFHRLARQGRASHKRDLLYTSRIETVVERLRALLRELAPTNGNWKPKLHITHLADAFRGDRKTTLKYVKAALNLGLIDQLLGEPLTEYHGDYDSDPEKGPRLERVYGISKRGLDFLKCFGDYSKRNRQNSS